MESLSLKKEEAFFHSISLATLAFVKKHIDKELIYAYREDDKKMLNVGTHVDVGVEKIIICEIQKRFPKDAILPEENYSQQSVLQKGRLWIIDPICGTINMTRGIIMFSTNIALAIDGKVVAGCVVDHSRGEYIWSTGDRKIYAGKKLFKRKKYSGAPLVHVELGSLRYCDSKTRERYSKFLSRIIKDNKYTLMSHTTSLSFVYVALGRVDAYVNIFEHVWDVPAINFLIEQAGGVVTDIDGNPWTLDKPSTVATLDKKLHEKLLSLVNP